MTPRICNLPSIVCKAANGEMFMVPLLELQRVMRRQKVGDDNVETLERITRNLTRRQELSRLKVRKDIRPGNDGDDDFDKLMLQNPSLGMYRDSTVGVDTQVLYRVNQTVRIAERYRETLQIESRRRNGVAFESPDDTGRVLEEKSMNLSTDFSDLDQGELLRHLSRDETNDDDAEALTNLGGLMREVSERKQRNRRNSSCTPAQLNEMRTIADGSFTTEDLLLRKRTTVQETEQVKVSGAATYEAKCHNLGVVPSTQVMKQLGKDECRVDHVGLGREGAEALAQALGSNNIVTRLSLVDCALDSKESSTRLHSQITGVDFSENPLGVVGAKDIGDILDANSTPHQFLTSLRLNKTSLGEEGVLSIVSALKNGNMKLSILSLSGTLMANKSAIAFGELFEFNHTLTELDLSWNSIKSEGAKHLARGLMSNATLHKLNLSWNGLENDGVTALGEMLMMNLGIKELNLISTRAGAEACLIISEGLKANDILETLYMDGNPIGDAGARHLMHALSQNKSLKFLGLQGSNLTSTVVEGEPQAARFNPACPDGSYELDLSAQAERTVAVQLCQLGKDAQEDYMRNVKLDGQSIPDIKSMDWPDRLPTAGILTTNFVTSKTRKTMTVIESKKLAALEAQFAKPAMSDNERLSIVNMFSPYNFFLCSQIQRILHKFSMGDERVEAAVMMFTRALDTDECLKDLMEPLHERESRLFYDALSFYGFYVFSNATGHYELNLTLPAHRHIANRLKDASLEEPESFNWKNIIYDQYSQQMRFAISYGPPSDWKTVIPSAGTLSLDYVSSLSAPEGATPTAEDDLQQMLSGPVGIHFEAGKPHPASNADNADNQIMYLRREVTNRYFECQQVKTILNCFQLGPQRIEIVVACYANILDKENFWQVLYALRGWEQSIAICRLGPTVCFDPKHPSLHWILDSSNPTHEEVTKKLVHLAASDTDLPNMWNIRLNGRKRHITENANMWAYLTTDTFTPFLEFDFLAEDAWELLGKTEVEVADMSGGDKLEARKQQAARLETNRAKQMYTYCPDDTSFRAPDWQTRWGLMQPLLDKPPWLAAWDRYLRRLVRLAFRLGEIQLSSPIEDLFDDYAVDDFMGLEDFLELIKDSGYSRSESGFYQKLFREATPSSDEVDPQNNDQGETDGDEPSITFDQFVHVFMKDPPPRHRSGGATSFKFA
ncbi:hypothetical protein BSKO_01461 [Bryopsis sp. KO-2023]|nr:hypothetical protein BSKO_01461 [Bryopsis sp. KO-2023]